MMIKVTVLIALFMAKSCVVDANHEVRKHSWTHSHSGNANQNGHHTILSLHMSVQLNNEGWSNPKHGFKHNFIHASGRDCSVLYTKGVRHSGVYTIKPDGYGSQFKVFCDMDTDGGGWTVFQKRRDGSVDFYRGWDAYRRGFGHVNGEFWLGNTKLNHLTHQASYQLRVDLYTVSSDHRYAKYDKFTIASEKNKFAIKIGKYSGNAGDSMTSPHNNQSFSTKDRDNDKWSSSCAAKFHGAWWYSQCHSSNLNGKYLKGPHKSYANGVNWLTWKGHHHSLARTEMKIRPTDFRG